jgi:periplasmic protein CpxP/Spy
MNKLSVITAALLLTAFASQAQPGDYKMPGVQERVAAVHQKMDSAFKPDAAKLVRIDSAFSAYYRGQDELRKTLFAAGERPDMQLMREKMAPLTEARDKELKAVLSEAEFRTWKDEIEPSMRRRGGGGGPRN